LSSDQWRALARSSTSVPGAWSAGRCKAGNDRRRPAGPAHGRLAAQAEGNGVDQGGQFTSIDRAAFLHTHNLDHSMSRRGNCYDNAVADSFFSLLKRERIRRRT